jgi:Ca-activated chloride channel family protein
LKIAILWLVLKRNNQAVTLKLVQFKGSKNQLLYWQETFFERIKIIGFKLLNCSYGKTKNDISNQNKTTKGIDIVMAVDVSGSMLAKDLKQTEWKQGLG